MVRVVALLVLGSAVMDYCTFDVADPWAPMSSALCSQGLERPSWERHARFATPAVRPNDLPDDGCLCCGCSVLSQPPVIAQTVVAEWIAPVPPVLALTPDPLLPDQPPRFVA